MSKSWNEKLKKRKNDCIIAISIESITFDVSLFHCTAGRVCVCLCKRASFIFVFEFQFMFFGHWIWKCVDSLSLPRSLAPFSSTSSPSFTINFMRMNHNNNRRQIIIIIEFSLLRSTHLISSPFLAQVHGVVVVASSRLYQGGYMLIKVYYGLLTAWVLRSHCQWE